MIKLHVFKKWRGPRCQELGHLYSDTGDVQEIMAVGKKHLSMRRLWLQNEDVRIPHLDLWGAPLEKAKKLFKIVSNHELADDMTLIRYKLHAG